MQNCLKLQGPLLYLTVAGVARANLQWLGQTTDCKAMAKASGKVQEGVECLKVSRSSFFFTYKFIGCFFQV